MKLESVYEDFADVIGPKVWPTDLFDIADKLAQHNPNFNKDKFISRAVNAWEETHRYIIEEPINDNIPDCYL